MFAQKNLEHVVANSCVLAVMCFSPKVFLPASSCPMAL